MDQARKRMWRTEGKRRELGVSSKSWASRSSVRDVLVEVRERVRLRFVGRRGDLVCVCGEVSLGSASMDLARLRRR
jgi:hypothetical protein